MFVRIAGWEDLTGGAKLGGYLPDELRGRFAAAFAPAEQHATRASDGQQAAPATAAVQEDDEETTTATTTTTTTTTAAEA